ncbi:hypothetical protein [Nocardia gipuzkoensis]|uniref:hypothetical protein n=1 Tax=Nocardia gipuzkoensis TaxID=2749991 RepID=UPI00237D3D05|nr:hypothetical protein [Nocardia gipuzkoensis]MDE1672021.1 hypothetical protein [Nocardia gipuzkoensis]
MWSPGIVHEPVISLQEWKQAQEVTTALRAGSQADGSLLRIRAAARRLGLTVTTVSSSATHTVCRIGGRKVVLPNPIPDVVVQQVIADMQTPT